MTDPQTQHNICWNQAADRLEEEVEYLLENVMQPLNEVYTLRKLIKEFREIAGKNIMPSFKTYDTSNGTCALCGRNTCGGGCFK